MDFIDGTIYIKHDGQMKPFTTQHNGYMEGYQTKAYGQYSHVEGYNTNESESTTLELQVQVKMLKSQMEEVIAAIKELKEEIDRINKRDAFDRYFGVDYLNSKDF